MLSVMRIVTVEPAGTAFSMGIAMIVPKLVLPIKLSPISCSCFQCAFHFAVVSFGNFQFEG